MKNLNTIIIFATVMVLTACNKDDDEPTNTGGVSGGPVSYNVGDDGPGGGYIFYVDEEDEYEGWKYLEVAPTDVVTEAEFPASINYMWASPSVTPATLSSIGAGMPNTAAIASAVQGQSTRAAVAANTFAINGFSDWFLPSRGELTLLYEAAPEDVWDWRIESANYWSSTGSGTNAWRRNFGTGNENADPQGTQAFVRPIRRFE